MIRSTNCQDETTKIEHRLIVTELWDSSFYMQMSSSESLFTDKKEHRIVSTFFLVWLTERATRQDKLEKQAEQSLVVICFHFSSC
jgi:hypothetical protein